MDHPCRGCVDAVMDPSGVGGCLCGYMDHNGHSRLLICPPGAACTVKSTVPRDPEQVRPERRYEATAGGGRRTCCWDQKLAKWLYEQGMNDAQIGRRVGTARQVIQAWRVRNGLPANRKRGGED